MLVLGTVLRFPRQKCAGVRTATVAEVALLCVVVALLLPQVQSARTDVTDASLCNLNDPHFLDGLSGKVVPRQLNSTAYESARLDWNSATSYSALPCVIVFCSTDEDVVNAVNWAVRQALPVAVRSGRHSYESYSLSSGLVIDVSLLRDIAFDRPDDPAAVTVGAGAPLWTVYKAVLARGLILPLGTCPTVGVAGYVLGGGYGFFSRALGLGADRLVAARVVALDPSTQWQRARVWEVNATSQADLWWALRGAGNGNFGVVVALTLRAVAAPAAVSLYTVQFDSATGDTLSAVVDGWQRWAPDAPRNLTAQLNVYHDSAASTGLYLGPAADLPALLRPLLQLPGGRLHALATLSAEAAVLQLAGCASVDDCDAQARQIPSAAAPLFWKGKSAYAASPLGAGARRVLQAYMGPQFRNCCAGNFAGLLLDPYGGAVADPDPAARAAFAHRHARFHMQLMVYWSTPADAEAAQGWAREFAAALRAAGDAAIDGAYVGYADGELADWPWQYYGASYGRLQAVKAAWDPQRVFVYAQAVLPASR